MIFIRAEVENKICGGREKKLPRSGLVQRFIKDKIMFYNPL